MIEIWPGVVLIPFLGIWPDTMTKILTTLALVSACACVRLPLTFRFQFRAHELFALCFRGNAWLRRWVETARGLGEISLRRQSLLMTQMKYEGIVRTEGSSLIPASFYDGYVPSLALWLSRWWRVASVCFRSARRDVTARRTPHPPTSFQLYPLILRFYQPANGSPSHGIFIQFPALTCVTLQP